MVMFIDGQYLLPGNVNCDAELGQYIIDCCQIPLYSTCIVGLSSPNNMFIHVSVKCRSATGWLYWYMSCFEAKTVKELFMS